MEKIVARNRLGLATAGINRSPSARLNPVDRRTPKPHELLTSVLREVSRSFYRTLRVLPRAVRPQISLAYLLARTTDTIADTGLVPLQRRLETLDALRQRILGLSQVPISLGELTLHQGNDVERLLLENCEQTLHLLQSLDPTDLGYLREVLTVITSGQELDLRRFDGASEAHIVALKTDAELQDYTYRVAGCVGEFWTRMCRAHIFPRTRLNDGDLLAKAVAFGKGLQLVNILRDLPSDLRQGRCYLPAEALQQIGLAPHDLLDAGSEPRLRPLYNRYLDVADEFLKTGWAYTELLPRRCVRVRLACAWPLIIGRETLALLRVSHLLKPQPPIKITRQQVKSIIWRSVLYYPWPSAWRQLFFSPQSQAPPAH